jgi:Abnormal spindle-like microcephaly-assoc'd, ASPM-SPD-2-Hydin
MKRLAPMLCVIVLFAACGGQVDEPPQPILTIVAADSLEFGSVLAGTSRALEVTLANRASDGPRIEPLENIAIGVNGAGLVVEHDCPASLASGQDCTIRVLAEPDTAGTISGTLVVASNAKQSPQTLPVSGRAVAALDPLQAAFAWGTGSSGELGPVDVGKSKARVVTIVNRGNQPGTVVVTLPGAGADWELRPNNCAGVTVQLGGNCNVTVTFTPAAAGAQTARLVLSDDYHQGFAETRLPLSGTGR